MKYLSILSLGLTVSERNSQLKQFAGVLLKQGDEFILQHRDDLIGVSLPGKYHIWGGAVEGAEKPEQAALRELNEETGVTLAKEDLVYLVSYEWYQKGVKAQTTIFLADIDPSIEVQCHEGKGLVRVAGLKEVPEDKLCHPIERAFAALEGLK